MNWLEALRRDRDQLWAEVATAETAGESIMLDESLWATAAEEQERRRTVDPWEDLLVDIPTSLDLGDPAGRRQIIWSSQEWPDQERVASSDLLTYVLHVPVAQQTSAHGQRLANMMERLGWQRPAGKACTLRINGKSVRGYWRSVQLHDAPRQFELGVAGSAP